MVIYNDEEIKIRDLKEGHYFIRLKEHDSRFKIGPRISKSDLYDAICAREWDFENTVIEDGNLKFLSMYNYKK
jgi:hypothetical protein